MANILLGCTGHINNYKKYLDWKRPKRFQENECWLIVWQWEHMNMQISITSICCLSLPEKFHIRWEITNLYLQFSQNSLNLSLARCLFTVCLTPAVSSLHMKTEDSTRPGFRTVHEVISLIRGTPNFSLQENLHKGAMARICHAPASFLSCLTHYTLYVTSQGQLFGVFGCNSKKAPRDHLPCRGSRQVCTRAGRIPDKQYHNSTTPVSRLVQRIVCQDEPRQTETKATPRLIYLFIFVL